MREIIILAEQLQHLAHGTTVKQLPRPLRLLFARSERRLRQPISQRQRVFELFGLAQDTASAPFDMLGDGIDPGEGYCVHADPVSLYVDLARVYITGWGAGHLDESEQQAIAGSLAEHFQDEGLKLHAATASHWYLSSETAHSGGFTPPEEALGCDIAEALPELPDLAWWKCRLNESQMILHRHPVIERRREQGRQGLESLWFWGGGRLPGHEPRRALAGVLTAGSQSLGLARWAGIHRADTLAALLGQKSELPGVVEFSLRPGLDKAAGLRQFSDGLLEPLISELRHGRVTELSVETPGSVYRLNRKLLRRFWKRASSRRGESSA